MSPRNKVVPLRLSEEEKDELTRAGIAGGRSLSAEIRYRLFPPGGRAMAQRDIVRIAGNDYERELVHRPPGGAYGDSNPPGDTYTLRMVRIWLAELQRLQKLGEEDPAGAFEEFKALCPQFMPPKGWGEMALEARAAYLDQHYPLEEK